MIGAILSILLAGSLLGSVTAEAAETDWLQHPMHRGAFNANAEVNSQGFDTAGWFHRVEEQRIAPELLLALAGNPTFTEGVMRRGQIVDVDSLEEAYTMFRATLRLNPIDAQALGVKHLTVAFKPAAKDWYGHEYRRELVFYKLARHLGIHGVLPMVERDVAYAPLRKRLNDELNETQKKNLQVFRTEDGRHLHGTVQLWMTGLTMRIGTQRSDQPLLREFAKTLKLGRNVDINGDPIWQTLSDMFVLDYLVYNSDRALEVGTVGLPDGGQGLILLDHGDALRIRSDEDDPYRFYDRRFSEIRAFSPNLFHRLETLTPEVLQEIWVDNDGNPLCDEEHFHRVSQRASQAVRRIHELAEEDGGLRRVLFRSSSRPMH